MDIFIADSGRPIKNSCVVTFVTPVGSGTIKDRIDGINKFCAPSGYNGNVTPSPYWIRFDDPGYYFTAHSGNFYGTPRDIRTNLL